MRATFVAEVNPIKIALFAALLLSPALQNSHATTGVQRDDSLKAAHQAYDAGEYAKAAQLLQSASAQNPLYHEWLGKAYGEKAGHAGMFSALSLAKKARKEFEKAVELDEKNFSAYQALIE